MDKKLNLTSREILEHEFSKQLKGYDTDQVDDFLDVVIKDYQTFVAYQKEVQDYIKDLETKIGKLQRANDELESSNGTLEHRMQGVKEGDGTTMENIHLKNRINALERALSLKGIDPKKIV